MMNSRIANQYGTARLLTALVLIAGTLFASAGLTAQAQSKTNPKKDIVGTWRMTVTLYDCTTGAERPPFQSMLSFAEGGILTGTTANPAFQPGQRSPDHGIWTAEGDHTYKFLSEAYILFTTEPNPPAPGFPRGVQRLTQTVEVNGDQLTTNGSAEFFDAAGNLVMGGCARAVGERME
jgi:hypothetical protein